MTSPFTKRLPHILTRAHLATLLAPTYAEAVSVDDEEALDRLPRALQEADLLESLYAGLEQALAEKLGPRMEADALLDKLSRGLEKRTHARPAPATPGLSAVMVRFNLALGLAPEPLRATLLSDKGRAIVADGFRALGQHLVAELLR